ncbi:GGDEF domain-containing protein [Marivita sp. S2033]|uniref:GGDEF domain-containing protein n=1 Tax=Marivita sp. S2033 TaxID=3373187 RepID=UPI0039827C5B
MRGLILADGGGGVILDLSFGIAVVDAVRKFDLTAQDFAASDLAVELLFLHEAKSSAMVASFSLNARLNGAKLLAENEALTDGLTGLRNRRALDSGMERLGQSNTEFAVLHLDLDHFKQVNDTLGHAVGDAVLKHVARVLRRHTRQDDLVVRAGGDEFLIVSPGLTDHSRLRRLAELLVDDIGKPISGHDAKARISASIGIALGLRGRERTPVNVIERADVALYVAKRSGRGCHVFWHPDHGQSLSKLSDSRDAAQDQGHLRALHPPDGSRTLPE